MGHTAQPLFLLERKLLSTKSHTDKGQLIVALLKELHDSDLFFASTCKFGSKEDERDTFTSIRWLPSGDDTEEAQDAITSHLSYLFNEDWITDDMVLKALLLSHNLKSQGGCNE